MTKRKKQPTPLELAGKLTEPQREALLLVQLGLFDHGSIVRRGMVATALRRRGLVGGLELTDLGQQVVEIIRR